MPCYSRAAAVPQGVRGARSRRRTERLRRMAARAVEPTHSTLTARAPYVPRPWTPHCMPRPCTPQVLSWVLIRVCWFPYLPLHFLCLTREPWPAGRHGVVAHIGVTAGVLALAVPRRVDTAGRPGRMSLAAPPCRLGTALAPPPLATPQPTTACHSPPARATARQLAISLPSACMAGFPHSLPHRCCS